MLTLLIHELKRVDYHPNRRTNDGITTADAQAGLRQQQSQGFSRRGPGCSFTRKSDIFT